MNIGSKSNFFIFFQLLILNKLLIYFFISSLHCIFQYIWLLFDIKMDLCLLFIIYITLIFEKIIPISRMSNFYKYFTYELFCMQFLRISTVLIRGSINYIHKLYTNIVINFKRKQKVWVCNFCTLLESFVSRHYLTYSSHNNF